jgi:hypothetical protein
MKFPGSFSSLREADHPLCAGLARQPAASTPCRSFPFTASVSVGYPSRSPEEDAPPAIHCGRQVISTCTGISFFTATAKSDGGSILKSDRVAGIVPEIRIWFP